MISILYGQQQQPNIATLGNQYQYPSSGYNASSEGGQYSDHANGQYY